MVTATLVFARCAGFVFRAPGVSHPSVPSTVRVVLALSLTAGIAPTLHGSAVRGSDSAVCLYAVAEFLLGSAMGTFASLVYDAAYAGGRVIDDYVGVKAIAPSLQLVAPSGFGRVWSLAFTGAFFLSGAYRLVLTDFAATFVRMPPGLAFGAVDWRAFAGLFGSSFLQSALAVAAPAIGLAFVVQVALGALSRVVPRFGSFTLSFPLAFAAALMATLLSVPAAMRGVPVPNLRQLFAP